MLLMMLFAFVSSAHAQSVILEWLPTTTYEDGSTIPSTIPVTYKLYYGASSGSVVGDYPYSVLVTSPANSTVSTGYLEYTIIDPTHFVAGNTYYFRATAIASGVESSVSNQTSGQAVASALIDTDKDGIADTVDNCVNVSNADQANFDKDSQGNACDTDDDNDGTLDTSDCAILNAGAWRTAAYLDTDSDGITNDTTARTVSCYGTTAPSGYRTSVNGNDNCDTVSNANQANFDKDSQGDACDTDDDNDGALDTSDCSILNASAWRTAAYLDTDSDGITDDTTARTVSCYGTTAPNGYRASASGNDNCDIVSNANQANFDKDAQGDVCDTDDDNDTYTDDKDCNTTNATLFRLVVLYADTNGDGYRDANAVGDNRCIGSSIPLGFTTNQAFAPVVTPPVKPEPTEPKPVVTPPVEPTPPAEVNGPDSDADGIPNTVDPDDDNDGVTDDMEAALGTNTLVADSDSDGSSDGQELLDGSNPLDNGSVLPLLKTTVCAEWNGFLGGMWNVFEHVNMSNKRLRVKTALYSINGETKDLKEFIVDAGAQYDLLVHDMGGRLANSYGKVCSTHDGQEGDLDGRMVYYKATSRYDGNSALAGQFEFAFAMPMDNGKKGNQFVTFNTYNPSLNSADSENLVANWIQLTNLNNTDARGTLVFYDMDGEVLGSQLVLIKAGARTDFSGHQFGSKRVGLVAWRPENNALEFQLRNVRYVFDNRGTENSFDTAFQLGGMYGIGELVSVSLDTNDSSAILEISNVLDEEVKADVNVYSDTGEVKLSLKVKLAPFASRHIIADEVLGNGKRGIATVKGSAVSSIVAVAMHYGRYQDRGISYMYGVPAVEALGSVLRSSYNTFLSQNSLLVLTNPTSEEQKVTVSMVRSDGTEIDGLRASSTRSVVQTNMTGRAIGAPIAIPAHGLKVINLSDYEQINVYGVVTVQLENENSVVSWILRQRSNDYVMPTPVR